MEWDEVVRIGNILEQKPCAFACFIKRSMPLNKGAILLLGWVASP